MPPLHRFRSEGLEIHKENPPHVRDEEHLMEAIRRREASAFETIFDRHNRLVFGIALRMLGDPQEAQDISQSVFLKLWHAPELFRGGNFIGWLARVTRNRCLDHLRARRADEHIETAAEIPYDAEIENTAFSNMNLETIRLALAEISKDQREAIEMGFFSGMTHEEIANRTGSPLGTVKTRIRSGLQKLRGLLDEAVNR